MKLLEERIIREGKVLPGDILKIDSFLNHQIDVELMDEIGKEFARIFYDTKPDKILTIEASGIATAQAVSLNLDRQPIIFAKKNRSINISNDVYRATERSYTRQIDFTIEVAKDYINENERILIIDDFIANGEAMCALLEICKQAKAIVVGCGGVVCKMYQTGYERIKAICPNLEALAKIKALNDDGSIEFE